MSLAHSVLGGHSAVCMLGGQLASGRVYERQPQVLVEADPTLHLLTDDWLGRNCCLSGYCTKSPQTHKYKYTNTNSKTQIQIHKCTSLMVPLCTCWLMIGCGGRNCIIKARYTFFNALSAFKKNHSMLCSSQRPGSVWTAQVVLASKCLLFVVNRGRFPNRWHLEICSATYSACMFCVRKY